MFFKKNYFAIFEASIKRRLINDTFSRTFNNEKMNEETNMHEVEKNTGKATKSRIGYLFGIIMLLIYLTMAYLLAFTPYFEATFNPTLLLYLRRSLRCLCHLPGVSIYQRITKINTGLI